MGDRVTRKIKHGVVLVELEDSVLVVKYDMEQVCSCAAVAGLEVSTNIY
jgi:hypothetical protein